MLRYPLATQPRKQRRMKQRKNGSQRWQKAAVALEPRAGRCAQIATNLAKRFACLRASWSNGQHVVRLTMPLHLLNLPLLTVSGDITFVYLRQ